jgi:photosystem II stability/assembly factor-like uncharacterized protein
MLILLSANLLTAQSKRWSNVANPTGHNPYGVLYSHRDTIVAVGDLGTKLRSTDGGNSWSITSSPVGDELRSVSFLGNTDLAVGILGRILRKQMPDSHLRCSLYGNKKSPVESIKMLLHNY